MNNKEEKISNSIGRTALLILFITLVIVLFFLIYIPLKEGLIK